MRLRRTHLDPRLRILDLFCGQGGCSVGYERAGFEVVGVDLEPQPLYPFAFIQADALTCSLDGFDAIHASPPCQGYSTMSNRHGSGFPRLIASVRERLQATGLPWVIENVPGARDYLRSPIELTGEMFGLSVHRPRLFESNVLLLAPSRPAVQKDPVAVYGRPPTKGERERGTGRLLWTRIDGSELRACPSLVKAREAMGMPWADWDGCREAVPPAYTEWVGAQLLRQYLEAAS